ncbi:MAG TPA: PP2C family protein-serine/threonine phosphatase [Spirochaetota bacterium]|nr:PP2C family protein-serine/threonine phosphatase [Spirochaetota bacterium]HPC41547.1 PP2C family protein-serine/threonine phosphatase [Spirochaetota bacterium]HQF09084.1 PP2C family protein-serine/threonine phosphatase [Spirochaetota bacterium]HQH97691.1 PP2C family protein-serine/threonine phosphatase [Spirochaetota bacterium]HQJ71329.1 PP2C family protein-serine/threonine phosphatase [Spirochaetota bacterium]
MKHTPDPEERRLKSEYRADMLNDYLRFSVIGVFVIFLGIAYYIYEDSVNGLPRISVLFRLVPVVLSAALLASILTPLRKRTGFIITLYYICLGGLMTMMAGLVVIVAGTINYESYVLGTVVVTICCFLCSFQGMKYLVPVYALPLAAALTGIIAGGKVPAGRIMIMSNPLIVAGVCCLMAEIQNRNRFRAYRASRIIEDQNALLNRELALAMAVQRNILPSAMPDLKSVEVAVEYIPMIGIGGDLYDFIEFGERGSFGLFVCDVSGHGVSAALVSSMVKAHLSSVRHDGGSPAALLRYLNEKLCGQISEHFVTAFYGVYRAADRSFVFARGGHGYPILERGRELSEIKSRGGFLGRFRTMAFEEKEVRLESGDRLILYTDGIIEARDDAAGTIFGEERLMDALRANKALEGNSHINAVIDSVRRFQGRDDFDDDVCLITMKVR